MPIWIPLFVIAAALVVVAVMLQRNTNRQKEALAADADASSADVLTTAADRPRPKLASFHVNGEAAEVTFDVPLAAEGADEIMKELLLADALEVVRDKKQTLPIDQVTRVVVHAGRPGNVVEVGVIELPERGQLPPPMIAAPQLHLGSVGFDPLDAMFSQSSGSVPETVARPADDTLGPIGDEIRLPRAVELGLRAQGIDPSDMDAGALVSGLLKLFGYGVSPAMREHSYTATKGGVTAYVRDVPHAPDDYPELDEKEMRSFLIEFIESKADKGFMVSDKYAPFSCYEMERSEPRIQFVTRERLQAFVDRLALS